MENTITTVVCPNCGANATNLQNCEYCNSILVRCYAAKASGINFEIDELKAMLNACNSEKIENTLRKFYKQYENITDGFVNLWYDSKMFLQLSFEDAGIYFNFVGEDIIEIVGNQKAHEIIKRVNELVKKFDYENESLAMNHLGFSVGWDTQIASQIIYLIHSWVYDNSSIDTMTWELVDIDESGNDIYVDANGNRIWNHQQKNINHTADNNYEDQTSEETEENKYNWKIIAGIILFIIFLISIL